MSWTPRARTLTILLLSITAAGAASAVDGPRGVSPGSVGRVAVMRDGCTTFSWQEVEGASGYELVAYELAEDAAVDTGLDPEQVREVLFVRLPGGVTSWTPEVSECLAPGGRYAWFVRAVFDAETGEATDWSAPLLFAIPGTPSLAEVEQALDVLLRYVEVGEESEGRARGGPDRREIANLARSATAKVTSRSVQTGTAAIRGEQPDSSGETYGVVGTSASPDGAGIGAANTAGGPDLVLDGSAAGASDAELSEGGIDRPSASAQTFTVGNSGGGGMTLQVDGVEVVTTATDQDTVGALSCAANEIAKFIGGVWVCAPDVDTNTDTLAALACHEGLIAKRVGGVWTCAPDDDTLAGLACGHGEIAKWDTHGTPSWTCNTDLNTTYASGNGITIVDGRVTLDPAWFTKRITILDGPDDVGTTSSVAIGGDGLPVIAYFDQTNQDLKLAHCDDALCSSASIMTFDDGGGGSVGSHVSMAIGTDGLPLIAYYDLTNTDLKVAHCDDALCAGATITTIPSPYDVGKYVSAAIGADGLGLISMADATNGTLRVAHCSNVECTAFSVQIVDNGGNLGSYTSLAIGTDGFGLISYHDPLSGNLKVAHCGDALCSTSTITSLDTSASVGNFCSIIIGSDGLGLISYYDFGARALKTAHCSNLACTTASFKIHTGANFGGWTATSVEANGMPLIAYGTGSSGLEIARCEDVSCSTATYIAIDSPGFRPSIAIGVDGLPIISYGDLDDYDLKVAHLPYGF